MAATSDSTSSTDRPQPASDKPDKSDKPVLERVAVGHISGAHGLQGNLSVRTFGGDPEHLRQSPALLLAHSEDDPAPESYDVVRVFSGRKGEVRITLAGVEDRTAAEKLRGRLVLVDADCLGALEEGEYYTYQLVGCRVESKQGESIGTVTEIWSTGAPDVLVVADAHGKQHLIPAAEGLLQEVDIEGRRIVVELVPGLLDGKA
jgi:16S rRNA processing protein RimM